VSIAEIFLALGSKATPAVHRRGILCVSVSRNRHEIPQEKQEYESHELEENNELNW
jgi:hypothetical protein